MPTKKKIRKPRKKISKKEINDTLKSIYQNKAGKKIDMKVHKRKKQPASKKILVGLIVFLRLFPLCRG